VCHKACHSNCSAVTSSPFSSEAPVLAVT
jgi:hypothetical protein